MTKGQPGTRTDRVTKNERNVLTVLKTGTWMRPVQMISRNRDLFGDHTPQGLHMTCASLVRKGWLERYPGPLGVSYHITPAGYDKIRGEQR